MADQVTVGEVMRFINEEHWKAGREEDMEAMDDFQKAGEQLQQVWEFYWNKKLKK